MHELAMTEHIVAICLSHAAGRPVRRVTLEIGRLTSVVPDSLRFYFDLCTKNTPLEGAVLEIIEISGRGRCETCGAERTLESLYEQCDCGSCALQYLAGQELKVKELELRA
ncbi:MAG: hydrogenase maturation nickel metallochaperone HypA [Magnetospiraceae bacterium]